MTTRLGPMFTAVFITTSIIWMALLVSNCASIEPKQETPTGAKEVEEIATPPAKKALKILWLGDSQSVGPNGLGDNLSKTILKPSTVDYYVARCSARPSQIAAGYKSSCGSKTVLPETVKEPNPSLETILGATYPDAIVIQMAGNLLGYSDSFVKADILKLLNLIPVQTPCLWVGLTERVGTSSLAEAKLDTLMRETIEPRCHYVDLLSEGTYPRNGQGKALKGDGTHLYSTNGKEFKELMEKYKAKFVKENTLTR